MSVQADPLPENPLQPDSQAADHLTEDLAAQPGTDFTALWQVPLRAARCPQCELSHLIPTEIEKPRCPACFAAQLEDMPEVQWPEPPEMMIPFTLTRDQIATQLETWLKGVWLRPKELDASLLAQRLTRSCLPMWLVDGQVDGRWQAEMGYDYQVASSQEVFRSGSWTSHDITETRIRWEPRAGELQRSYHNLSLPALEGYDRLRKALGGFDPRAAHPYLAQALAGSSVRVPNLLPDAAWPLARSGFDRLAAEDCQFAAAAQHVEKYQINAQYQDLNWTQLLLPVYTTAYRDEQGQIIAVMINGQNGKVFGVRRAAQGHANRLSLGLGGLALLCFIVGIACSAGTALLPVLSALGAVLLVGGLLLGISAPIPAIWAWNFNRDEMKKET